MWCVHCSRCLNFVVEVTTEQQLLLCLNFVVQGRLMEIPVAGIAESIGSLSGRWDGQINTHT